MLTLEQASKYLGVSAHTLRRWEKEGKITSHRTKGNHRRYTQLELDRIMNGESSDIIAKINTFTHTEEEVNKFIEFIKKFSKEGLIITIEKA